MYPQILRKTQNNHVNHVKKMQRKDTLRTHFFYLNSSVAKTHYAPTFSIPLFLYLKKRLSSTQLIPPDNNRINFSQRPEDRFALFLLSNIAIK